MEVDRDCLLILEVSRVTCERKDFSFYDAIWLSKIILLEIIESWYSFEKIIYFINIYEI